MVPDSTGYGHGWGGMGKWTIGKVFNPERLPGPSINRVNQVILDWNYLTVI